MKKFKLQVHQNTSNFSDADLVINPKDFDRINIGDVVEIYEPADEHSRLLLQVTEFKDDLPSKDTVSVECSIASSFHLRTYSEVYVNIVNPKNVALDSVEIIFRDQYLARSDMWRLKQNVDNTCVYVNKTVTLAGIRVQVYEMWSQGERVASGVITHNTKVVFRSSTSMVYLFMQMSSEMWDFDINGDLYFEKGVNGFLADLFAKWKTDTCNHDVTVVLFSRTFYKAQSIEEFPEHMRECLQQDYKGRFYEDFYRVAIQNERYDDWSNILVILKRLFNQYKQTVLNYHEKPGVKIPEVYNSTAAQGNFLEVLNMSLNVFERHYIDRSLDRTGQLSVVLTPGVGVFEVDRELANVTKQRIIDSGIGSDLVCLGEQPLHAVPLFKFQSKQKCYSVVDDYNIPHWINLSFYSCTNKRLSYSNFVPRLKLPTNLLDDPDNMPLPQDNDEYTSKKQDETFPSLFDYDAYDAEVFKYGAHSTQANAMQLVQAPQHPNKSCASLNRIPHAANTIWRKMSEDKTASGALILPSYDDLASGSSLSSSKSCAISIPSSAHDSSMMSVSYGALHKGGLKKSPLFSESDSDFAKSPLSRSLNRLVVGSAGVVGDTLTNGQPRSRNNSGSNRPSRALINPFDPSHLTIKLTSNRRRWTHVFPLGPKGGFMQEHHRKVQPEKNDFMDDDMSSDSPMSPRQEVVQAAQLAVQARKHKASSTLERNKDKYKNDCSPVNIHPPANFAHISDGYQKSKPATFKSASYQANDLNEAKNILAWGATGEQEWTPDLTTGVDWKSLTMPACLPITTDYFPDKRSLQNDYVISDYCLHPDDISADFAPTRPFNSPESGKRQTMPVDELFKELVLQRLQQSFQIIILPKTHLQHATQTQISSSPQFTPNLTRSRSRHEFGEEYFLSIGRIFHKLSLVGPMITVTQFRPRHPYPQINVHYRYRFQAPDNQDYGVSWVNFTTQLLENFGWNYLDHYICMKGEGDYALKDTLKYWRLNLAVLPLVCATTKKIIDESLEHCHIYPKISEEEQITTMDGFGKFLEILNKIKRPNNARKPKNASSSRRVSFMHSTSAASSIPGTGQQQQNVTGFRDRVSSNRVHDRPRTSSGSKVRERNRSESSHMTITAAPAASIDLLNYTSDSLRSLSSNDSQTELGSINAELNEKVSKLSAKTSSLPEIIEQMKNGTNGLSFLNTSRDLVPYSFICAEAVDWMLENVDGLGDIRDALKLLENMKQEKYLTHSSGLGDHPIIYGFYIYCFVEPDSQKDSLDDLGFGQDPIECYEEFQKQWFEVQILNCRQHSQNPPCPPFLDPNLKHDCDDKAALYDKEKRLYRKHTVSDWKDPVYKSATFEMKSVWSKDSRLEWGSVQYHTIYKPSQAFEMIVQWMVATGSILSELLTTWQRKATPCGLNLIPIPSDPFALPFSGKSDPLRGPVFVPLEVKALMGESQQHLFEDYAESEHEKRMMMFQEAIVLKFGFIPMQRELERTVGGLQYIHLSGGMFVMITRKSGPATSICQADDFNITNVQPVFGNKYKVEVPTVSNPHEEYITRHVTTRSADASTYSNKVGFLWSWNHMLSKRWRTVNTCETQFQDKLLADFLNFCSNKDKRLEQYWQESVRQLMQASRPAAMPN